MNAPLRTRRTRQHHTSVTRPQGWALALAASFCLYFALLVYCDLVRPENPGFQLGLSDDGAVIVTDVRPETPAARSGLRVGDRVLSMNGTALVSADSAIGTIYEIGVPMPIQLSRDGDVFDVTMRLDPPSWSYWRRGAGGILLVVRLAQLLTLACGLFVLARRPHDPAALAAVWFLLSCAVFTIGLPFRIAGVWRNLPLPLGILPWFAYASALAIGTVLLTFTASFPLRLSRIRLVLGMAWATTLVVIAPPLYNFGHLVYVGETLRAVSPGTAPLLTVTIAALAASVFILAINYRRLEDVTERRRVRLVLAGIATAVLPGFAWVVSYWTSGRADLTASLFESPAAVAAAIALLGAPLSITHAVLRHRLFDIGFIVRRWLQYALAKWAVLSIAPVLVALVVLDLLAHGEEAVNDVLHSHGLMYVGLMATALVAYWLRRRWVDALDRRFFREHHHGYALLREVAEQIRRSGSLDRVAPLVVARIEAALHPEFTALLLRGDSGRTYRTLAAAPVAYAPPDLQADSKLVALARVLEAPLDASEDSTGVQSHLPPKELEFVQRAGIDLLVPVVTPDDQLEALLVLGRKRSEEPYAHEDHDLLVAIAENLALLIARSRPPARTPMLEECDTCGACFDDGTGVCEHDARRLEQRELPRTLAGRYRLLRRLGAGGMGRVYEAMDAALDKRVAVKVVRDDLPPGLNAAERLVDEAKLAAKLVHPNVVTMLDFGVVDGRSPFLVMELLFGRTLRQVLDGTRELPKPLVMSVLQGVCSAVTAAHRLGLLHRDLKPENIFLVESEDGPVPKVLDFGIARPLTIAADPQPRGAISSGILPGTPEYMAPERLRGERATSAWDLWSIAIVAYEMVAMNRPLVDAPVAAWDPGAPLRKTHPHCAAFFSRALAIDPAVRPPDAAIFLSEFERAFRADAPVYEANEGRHGHVRMWS